MEWTADTSALVSAGAAVASALFAAATFVLYRKEINAKRRDSEPVVELRAHWAGERESGPIAIEIIVRNPRNCALEIGTIRGIQPRSLKVSFSYEPNSDYGGWGLKQPTATKDWSGARVGAADDENDMSSFGDQRTILGSAVPPANWNSGKIAISVELIEAAARRKRIVKKAYDTLAPRSK